MVRFFVASNAGSFLGLLTYPFFIEHLLTSPMQAQVWSWMFMVYAVLLSACAVLCGSRTARSRPIQSGIVQPSVADPVLSWVALSMVGSTLMLATANAIMQWSAVVPFLWVLPLSTYLLTFYCAPAPAATAD